MIYLPTGHSTTNYKVVEDGDYIYCESYGHRVARFVNHGGKYIEFGELWDYSQTTIRHVKWFLKEIRRWQEDVSLKSLRSYVTRSNPWTFINVVDFNTGRAIKDSPFSGKGFMF